VQEWPERPVIGFLSFLPLPNGLNGMIHASLDENQAFVCGLFSIDLNCVVFSVCYFFPLAIRMLIFVSCINACPSVSAFWFNFF